MKSSSITRTPMRTCVACRTVRAKRELVRLVQVTEGAVQIDSGGKKPGRGVYLCPAPRCWEIGLKRGCLERALRASLCSESREELARYGQSLGQNIGSK